MCAYGRGGRVGDAMFLNPEANGKGGRLPPLSQIWNDAPAYTVQNALKTPQLLRKQSYKLLRAMQD